MDDAATTTVTGVWLCPKDRRCRGSACPAHCQTIEMWMEQERMLRQHTYNLLMIARGCMKSANGVACGKGAGRVICSRWIASTEASTGEGMHPACGRSRV